MKELMTPKNLMLSGLAASLALITNLLVPITNVWLSPTGSVLRTGLFVLTILQIGLFILVLVQYIAQLSTNRFMMRHHLILAMSLVYVIFALIGGQISNGLVPSLQSQGYLEFIDENQILIEAITDFETKNGRPPNDWAELLPDYLPTAVATIKPETIDTEDPEIEWAIEHPSLDAASAERVSYSYSRLDNQEDDPDRRWELSVRVYLGSFQSAKFIYNPTQNYSESYQRLGQWGQRGAY